MAVTSIRLKAEKWVRDKWLPRQIDATFEAKPIRLFSNGEFNFDAVSEDGKVAACISTSSARTASGGEAVAKIQKIRADMYFLLLADVTRRLAIFTEKSMHAFFIAEQNKKGRVPQSIEFMHAKLPPKLRAELRVVQEKAARKFTPEKP